VSDPAFAADAERFRSARTWALASYAISAAATGFGVWWWIAHPAHGTVAVEPRGGGAVVTWTIGGAP
jgi:hypothetical protein